ncbi:hypothetical protein L0244_04015 [bacterium]|nr:hypothetical protein [bacterium]MCI0612135.1 hypothetical protein [bacterium]
MERVVSMNPERRMALPEYSWHSLEQAGAYVEKGTGDLYRIPKEALMQGASPFLRKESFGASRLVQISKNPFVTTLEARMICSEYNIIPNF